MWDDELDSVMLAQLTRAYSRRKKWESELLATLIVNTLGEAMQKGQEPKEISPAEMFERLGE